MRFRTRVNDDSTAELLGEYELECPDQTSQRQSSQSRIARLPRAPLAGENVDSEVVEDYQLQIHERNSPYGHYTWDCPMCEEKMQGGGKEALAQRALTHLAIAHDKKIRTKDHRACLRDLNQRNRKFYYAKR